MIKHLCIALFFCSMLFAQDQDLAYKGKVVDSNSKLPLAFVNIGVVGENVGTVSDENGEFEMIIPHKLSDKLIRYSYLGYIAKTYKVGQLFSRNSDYHQVQLGPTSFKLPNAIISEAAYSKSKELGVKKGSDNMFGGFNSNNKGCEVGIKIKWKKKKGFLKDFSFYLVENEYDTLHMRLHIYRLKDGKPVSDYLNKNIFITTMEKNGWITKDLSSYELEVEEDFGISLEWIQDFGPPEQKLNFGIKPKGKMFWRQTSHANWENHFGSPAFKCTVLY